MAKLRYSDFADRIDVDGFEEAIGFDVSEHFKGEDKGYCPDPWGLHKHGDRTGKFALHREKRLFNCWVCGGGTLLSLAMAIHDMGEQEATDWLYQFTTPVEESNEDFLGLIEGLLVEKQREEAVLPYFNKNVLNQYHDLSTEDWELFDTYLRGRGISEQVSGEYLLGFDPTHERRSSRGNYVGPAIIFPHFWGDRLVGWQERWIDDHGRPEWLPKYTNTNDFPKRTTIYGYERVFLATLPIAVVESIPTVLRLASLGYPAVATFGSSVTDEQIKLLKGCQQGLILCPDSDKAGLKWIESLTHLEHFVPLRIAEFDPDGEGEDYGDFPAEVVAERLENASIPGLSGL